MPTITECLDLFLSGIKDARTENTYRHHVSAAKNFKQSLLDNDLDPNKTPIELLTEEHISKFITGLKKRSKGTEQVYITDMKKFYLFLGDENVRQFNYPRIVRLIKFRKRKPPVRLPQFPEDDIKEFLEHIDDIINPEHPFEKDSEKLRAYRDRAFIITIADTGMRVSEICGLIIGSVDRRKGITIILGKNNEEAVVRFTKRSLKAIREYLDLRYQHDMKFGTQRASLPVFIRHDQGASRRNVAPMSTSNARSMIMKVRIPEILKRRPEIKISPHSFRHFFVTQIYKKTKDVLLAKGLARHKNIETTKIYTHLDDDDLDKGYHDVFGE